MVWGRRRVGKTYLLTHFAEGKRAVYFTATRQDSDERQLQRFADALREQLDQRSATSRRHLSDWEAALRFVGDWPETGPLLLVLDEAPRLTSGPPIRRPRLGHLEKPRSGNRN